MSKYKVYFIGEQHHQKGNNEAFRVMLHYLYYNANLRTVVMEAPASYEEFINAYILRNNKDSLKAIKVGGFNKEIRNIFSILHNFNSSKPSDKQVVVRTIDIESDIYLPLKYLSGLLPSTIIPSQIATEVNQVKQCVKANCGASETFRIITMLKQSRMCMSHCTKHI